MKKGHSLKISKGGRARLLVDVKSQRNTTCFLRKTLFELYGSQQLSLMNAVGRKKESIGIPLADLNTIYGTFPQININL